MNLDTVTRRFAVETVPDLVGMVLVEKPRSISPGSRVKIVGVGKSSVAVVRWIVTSGKWERRRFPEERVDYATLLRHYDREAT